MRRSAPAVLLFVFSTAVLAVPTAQDVAGGAEVRLPRTASWRALVANDEIPSGSRIRTRLGARVSVKLDDGSRLSLRENSIFEVVRSTAGRHEFRLWQGELRNQVQPIPTGGFYQITTPVAVAGVRGTDFEMNVQDDGFTRLRVFEGSVAFRSTVGSGAEVLVGAGQASNADASGNVASAARDASGGPSDAAGSSSGDATSTGATLRIESPAPGTLLSSPSITVFGAAAPGSEVLVNGVRATADAAGRWTAQLSLGDGLQPIVATSGENRASLDVTVDASAPSVDIDVVPDLTTSPVLTLSVRTAPGATVSALGATAQAPSGSASLLLTLSPGENLITVTATGANGKTASRTIRVVLDQTPPTLTIISVSTVSSGIRVVGLTEVGATVYADNFPLSPRSDGSFDEVVSGLSSPVTFEARDVAGNITRDVRSVTGAVDNEPPSFSSVDLSAATAENGQSVTVTVVASDPSGLASSLAVTLSGGDGGSLSATLSASGSGYTGTVLIPATATSGSFAMDPFTLVDALGNATSVSPSATLTVTNAAPTAPAGLNVSDPGSGGALTVSWSPVSEPDVSLYYLFQGATSGGPYAQIAVTGGTSHSATGLTNGTTYYFVVKAQDNAGNYSLPSAERSGIPTNTTPPPTPAGLSASSITASGLTLSWGASSGAATYKVYRSLSASGGAPYANIGQTASTTFPVSGLAPGTTYHFAVTALDNNPTPNESTPVGANEIPATTAGGAANP